MSSLLQDMIHTVSSHVEKVTGLVDKMENRLNGMADRVDDMAGDLKGLKTDNRDQRERLTKIEAIQARSGDITINNEGSSAHSASTNVDGNANIAQGQNVTQDNET